MLGTQLPLQRDHYLLAMNDQNTAIGAIGAVLGYIGAEGATTAIFERLLWPQRAHANFTWRHVLKFAVMGPSGGPIYKAALQVMDGAFANRLLVGSRLGHMLGTAFFPQSTSTFTAHGRQPNSTIHTESTRNCIWERVVNLLSPSPPESRRRSDAEAASRNCSGIRAYSSVHHITLSVCKLNADATPAIDVRAESRRITFNVVAGIVVSESVGVMFALLVVGMWRSWLAVLWVLPLLIKLSSAVFALDREELCLGPEPSGDARAGQEVEDFEIHLPLETSAFLILTGPRELVLQFFRHYAHPKRSRLCEIMQLFFVVALAGLFPIGLLLSVTVMPETIQYLWLSYQMYLVVVMYVSRYMSANLWASTEEFIAAQLVKGPGSAALFVDRVKGMMVKATLQTTTHSRYGEGRSHTEALLARMREGEKSVASAYRTVSKQESGQRNAA